MDNNIKGKWQIGKVDYNNSGYKNCIVEVEWELKNGNFSMEGGIWNSRNTDYYTCGQCLEEILELFPNNKKLKHMVEIWREYHLNDLTAGSPAQEAWLSVNLAGLPGFDYSACLKCLEAAGLSPDTSYFHNGKPYEYGSAWLKTEIPKAIQQEIVNW